MYLFTLTRKNGYQTRLRVSFVDRDVTEAMIVEGMQGGDVLVIEDAPV